MLSKAAPKEIHAPARVVCPNLTTRWLFRLVIARKSRYPPVNCKKRSQIEAGSISLPMKDAVEKSFLAG
jgi:hypothetical protein